MALGPLLELLLGSASTMATVNSLPYPSERWISLLPRTIFSQCRGYCLLTFFEALSSALVYTAHRSDMVGEGEEVRIKEQKYKCLWHVGRRVTSHVAGKITTISLFPLHPQLVLRLFHAHLSVYYKSQLTNRKLLHLSRTIEWILRNICSND